MKILDGKGLSKKIKNNIKEEVKIAKKKYKRAPGLAVILVGEDKASEVYVNMKEKACQKAGINSKTYKLDKNISQKELIKHIDSLNENEEIDGILVQLPLPKHMDENLVNSKISPKKDIDGFHAVNTGKLFLGEKGFIPCTPKGIVRLIKEYDIKIEGKNVVVVGRSNIVGKPSAMLLLNENATVEICHSKTRNLKEHTLKADIIIAACGKAELIKGDMIKDNAIIIDAGTNKINGKLVGDVEYEALKDKAGFITPVPGGVGPMTIAMLLENTLEAYYQNVVKSN
ncbi:MAG: bifunctional methylenetetrahydrofolate dehydrogenase/methenyltetrahydrofolate cyclohydrolase FolD [Firmicutes bacterium]|nr:bifunctional methylenetetrahydrofolate dehydrogenase/methenyltetrahydrofolate cyclohydrolase FolD [Bacillota bacterium]